MKIKLIPLNRPGDKIEYGPIFDDEITLGRQNSNLVVIDWSEDTNGTTTVSREHALIFQKEGKVYIKDLNSSYGTQIIRGEEQVSIKQCVEINIMIGDTIRLGKAVQLKLEMDKDL
ncbi:MAG: FHA domain-containing protein, partial [Chloroflexota bacterium]